MTLKKKKERERKRIQIESFQKRNEYASHAFLTQITKLTQSWGNFLPKCCQKTLPNEEIFWYILGWPSASCIPEKMRDQFAHILYWIYFDPGGRFCWWVKSDEKVEIMCHRKVCYSHGKIILVTGIRPRI